MRKRGDRYNHLTTMTSSTVALALVILTLWALSVNSADVESTIDSKSDNGPSLLNDGIPEGMTAAEDLEMSDGEPKENLANEGAVTDEISADHGADRDNEQVTEVIREEKAISSHLDYETRDEENFDDNTDQKSSQLSGASKSEASDDANAEKVPDPEEMPTDEELMSIVAPSGRRQDQEEASPSAMHKDYLISYKTFLTWFLEKIRPEAGGVEFDSATDAASPSSPAVPSTDSDAAANTKDAFATTFKDNETAPEGPGVASSQDPATTPPPVEGVAEQNESQKCSGFGCILKLNQRSKSIKCTPRNMTILEKKREGATLDDLTRVHIFLTQVLIDWFS